MNMTKDSQIVLEEAKEISLSALEILDTNNDVFLLKLKKNSGISIMNEDDWNLLSIFHSKMITSIHQKINNSNFSEEFLDFLIKSMSENPHIDLKVNIYFDTEDFKALTLKIYKLCSLSIQLQIIWSNDFKIKLKDKQEEKDLAKFVKFLALLSYLAQSSSGENNEINPKFSLEYHYFSRNIEIITKKTISNISPKHAILEKAVKKCTEIIMGNEAASFEAIVSMVKSLKKNDLVFEGKYS